MPCTAPINYGNKLRALLLAHVITFKSIKNDSYPEVDKVLTCRLVIPFVIQSVAAATVSRLPYIKRLQAIYITSNARLAAQTQKTTSFPGSLSYPSLTQKSGFNNCGLGVNF